MNFNKCFGPVQILFKIVTNLLKGNKKIFFILIVSLRIRYMLTLPFSPTVLHSKQTEIQHYPAYKEYSLLTGTQSLQMTLLSLMSTYCTCCQTRETILRWCKMRQLKGCQSLSFSVEFCAIAVWKQNWCCVSLLNVNHTEKRKMLL